MKRIFYAIGLLGFSVLFASCSTVPKPAPPTTIPSGQPSTSVQPSTSTGPRRTVTHKVGPGETFWRISKMYDVPIASLMMANRMKSTQELRMGQKLTVPMAANLKPVISFFPSRKWRYIIIHHSATEAGSSLAFHKAHLQKGWDKGVGYHFIIDNNSDDRIEGEIEMTPRWIKQQDGAHCKASDMNTRAIGICLVGNFDQESVSPQQMQALVFLVDQLQKYYNIPSRNILGHGDVDGATTHCPGHRFPWATLRHQLHY